MPDGGFITDFRDDPFAGRLLMLVYGRQKIGKTSLLLKLVEPWQGKPSKEGPIVYLISADRGTKRIHLDGDKYKGRIAIAYPGELREYRRSVAEVHERVEKMLKKKQPKDIWVAIDTVTHMQILLLTEARTIEVKAQEAKKRKSRDPENAYVRDALTRVDYNVNLGHMAEITNAILRLKANILFIALEKEARDANDRSFTVPALSGQSKEKILGDADIVARMSISPKDADSRVFLLAPGQGWDAGDRTGRLDEMEPADLQSVYDKVFRTK
jgi:hypothetical protein